MSTYRIQFGKGVAVPDLAANSKLAEILTVENKQEDWCVVNSKLNDEELRKLLVEEYNLPMKDVVVVSTQIAFGAAAALSSL